MKTAMVVGAGIVGACTAHYLSQKGFRVIVLERRGQAALETSFANGGQISACHSVPWSSPDAPLKVLRWAFDPESPLCFRPKMDTHQWKWLLQFMLNCKPAANRRNTEAILRLALYSRAAYLELFEKLGVTNNIKDLGLRHEGIMHIYRSQKELARGVEEAKYFTEMGLIRHQLNRDQIVKIEPSLSPIVNKLTGATYTASDMSGDAKRFTDELASYSSMAPDLFGHVNVQYHYLTEVERLYQVRDRVGVQLRSLNTVSRYRECYEPDMLVLCTATETNQLLSTLNLKTMIYPAKGYSATFRLDEHDQKSAPRVSITDDEKKIVYSRLQPDILRVAGTAELSGYDDQTLRFDRCMSLVNATHELFPLHGMDQYAFWTGLRPLTPSNRPYVCKAPFSSNLWLNTGHGSMGWTLGAGSAKLIAELSNRYYNGVVAENFVIPETNLQLDPTQFEYKTPH